MQAGLSKDSGLRLAMLTHFESLHQNLLSLRLLTYFDLFVTFNTLTTSALWNPFDDSPTMLCHGTVSFPLFWEKGLKGSPMVGAEVGG